VSPGSIRAAVVADKAAVIERMLAGVAALPLASESGFLADPHMVAAGESYLRRALEALFDVGRHVLAKGFADHAAEYKEVARRLGEVGVLEPGQVEKLRTMAGYRNRLVHFYDEVTPSELYRILTAHLGDIPAVLDGFRSWLAVHRELLDEGL